MLRTALVLMTLLASLAMLADAPLTAGDKEGGKSGKTDKGGKDTKHKKTTATVVKVDAKTGTVTVVIKEGGKKSKGGHKTLKLTTEVKIFDSKGKVTKIDIFQSGDKVIIVEHQGKLHELHHHGRGTGKTDGKK